MRDPSRDNRMEDHSGAEGLKSHGGAEGLKGQCGDKISEITEVFAGQETMIEWVKLEVLGPLSVHHPWRDGAIVGWNQRRRRGWVLAGLGSISCWTEPAEEEG